MQNKIAIVTGASSGIGAELTKKLAAQGITVYAVARRESELSALKNLYPDYIHPICADLSTEQGIEDVIESVEGLTIDYLVNNAGILGLKSLNKMTYQDYLSILTTNSIAPALLTGNLAWRNDARIINISSLAASNSFEGLVGYSMSKGALNSLTEVTQKEFGQYNQILTISFIPGEVDTMMQEQLRHFPVLSEKFQDLKRSGQLLHPEISAQCLSWLLLEATPEQFLLAKSVYDTNHQALWLNPGQSIPEPSVRVSNDLE